MKEHKERYEFDWETVNNEDNLSGIVFDVVTETPEQPDPMQTFGLLIMEPDKGQEHHILGKIEFKDKSNLKLAQMGLELIQEAMMREDEL